MSNKFILLTKAGLKHIRNINMMMILQFDHNRKKKNTRK